MMNFRRAACAAVCAWALVALDAGSPLPTRPVALGASAATVDLKFAFWNMQYGVGVPAAGVACAAADDSGYGTHGAGNAWGRGHLQAYLTTYVRDDPAVVAFGATEVNPAFAASPSAVLAHLGWAARVEVADEALFARHGFAATDWLQLTPCGGTAMYAVYGKVWTSSARTDWVHVVSTHFMHPHVGGCTSGVQVDEVMQWIASKATDGRPVVLMGDLNVVVENTDPVIYFPDHITRLAAAGYADAWRTVFPDASTHPGPTATWHSTSYNPLPSSDLRDWGLWKRIDYVFARNASVVGARLFNHDIGDPRNCAASDHAGIVATIRTGDATPLPPAPPPPAPPAPVASTSGLAAPWSAADIGAVGIAGWAAGDSGALQVAGAGHDIWGTVDAFRFVYQPLSGDGSVTARVTSLAGSHEWSKAGVMLRADLSAHSAHALMLASGARGLAFQRRTGAAQISTHTDAGDGGAPAWVRLVRRGHTVTAFRSADGVAWTQVGSDTIAFGQTVYAGVAVTSHDPAALATAAFASVQVTPHASIAPAPHPGPSPGPWSQGDIGAPALPGSASSDGDRVTVRGGGADIWGTADAFYYVHQRMTANGSVTVRVASLDAVHTWSKAGVMIRESLEANSAHAMLVATPHTNGVAFQRRLVTGGISTHTSGGPGGPPQWLRLERRGDQIIASRSPDGITWTEVGRDSLSMRSTVYVGLAVTSHDDTALTQAVFDNISIAHDTAPGGWLSTDIGAVAVSGGAALADGSAVIRASGEDIWNTSDEFHYAYQMLHGNFDLEARVSGIEGVHVWTKAGLMIRNTTSSDSVHLSLFATPAHNGVAFQRRLIAGGVSIHTAGPAMTPPVWLRLSRHGSTVSAFTRATESDAWEIVAQEWVPDLPATVLAGLAVTSHLDGAVATATFDNVTIVPAP